MPEEIDKPYIRVRGTALGERYKIANVVTPIYEGVLPSEAEQTRCNARLIAAAPDLLEALELARDHIDMTALDVSHCKDAERIRAAIAKATGQKGGA